MYIFILALCERVNNSDRGTSDPIRTELLDIYCQLLTLKLANWTPSRRGDLLRIGYDQGVRKMVEASRSMCLRRFKEEHYTQLSRTVDELAVHNFP